LSRDGTTNKTATATVIKQVTARLRLKSGMDNITNSKTNTV